MDAKQKAEEWVVRALSDGSYVTGEAYGIVKGLLAELEKMAATANCAFLDGRKNAEAELEAEQGRWQDAIYKLLGELAPGADIDGGGCDSGDPLDLTLDEISQGFGYWDSLLFDAMESASHSYVGTPTFKAAAEFIIKLAKENEELAHRSCDECSPENYGWVFNRVEGRGACTCMVEAEPFQILLKALEKIADPDAAWSGIGCAMEALDALRAVLPLDYINGVKSEEAVRP